MELECPLCGEPDSHHVILGKPVDVNVWHLVWCGKGRILKPSDADIDWDLPVELAPIETKLMKNAPVPRQMVLMTGQRDPYERKRGPGGRFTST